MLLLLFFPFILLLLTAPILPASSTPTYSQLDSTPIDQERDSKFLDGSPLPQNVQVGEVALGEQRLYYTFINNTALITGAGVIILGFFAVAVGLFLYDYFVLGNQGYGKKSDTADSANFDPTDPYIYENGFDASRIRKRSADDGYSAMNVLKWITMLQEVYEKFDYNDLECQKRLICDIMQEEKYFGPVSTKMRSGFEMAKYLEVFNLPDDFREILDEYIDASDRASGQKECEEFFQCPYSLKEVVKRNFSFNSV